MKQYLIVVALIAVFVVVASARPNQEAEDFDVGEFRSSPRERGE